MAIIVEEKRDTKGVLNWLVWVAILAIITSPIYYIFFKKPELIEFTSSSSFKNIQELSRINIDSGQLVNSPQFQALKQYVTVAEPQNLGRTNPFLGF